jgi:hypothetical protein
MKTSTLFCSAILLGGTVLRAQDDGRVVKFRLLCYEQVKDVTKAMVAGDGGGKQEVVFYSGGFGPQVSGKFTGGKVRFFTEAQGPDGKPVATIVAEGILGPSAVQMFLLFPQGKDKTPVYKVLAFDDLEKSFPMGATRVINLASCPIRLNLAGADMPPLKPGGVEVYPQVKKADEWNMFTARVDFAIEPDKWVPVSTQSWKSSNQKRDWVITQFDAETRQPAIRHYQDLPPWREPAPPVSSKKVR